MLASEHPTLHGRGYGRLVVTPCEYSGFARSGGHCPGDEDIEWLVIVLLPILLLKGPRAKANTEGEQSVRGAWRTE